MPSFSGGGQLSILNEFSLEPYLPTTAVRRRPVAIFSFDTNQEPSTSNMWFDTQSTPAGFSTDQNPLYPYKNYGDSPRAGTPLEMTCAQMKGTPVTLVGKKASIIMPPSKIVEFELLWNTESSLVDLDEYTLRFHFFDGTDQVIGEIKYDWDLAKWLFLDSTGTFVDITGGAQALNRDVASPSTPGTSRGWNRTKLALDFNTEKYIFFVNNELIVDLSANALRKVTNSTRPKAEIQFEMLDKVNQTIWNWQQLDVNELI